MDKDTQVREIIALFHDDKPVTYKLEEIRLEDNDKRYVLYVNFPHAKYVIKIASNNFTTTKRVNGWVGLINEYRQMGYYSPLMYKSLNNNYAEVFTFLNDKVVVWEEEYAKYYFLSQLNKGSKDVSKSTYQNGIIEFLGKVAEKHIQSSFGISGWARLEPFGQGDETDEVKEWVRTVDGLVKDQAPQFLDRWREILKLYEQNENELRGMYYKLPTSVFQADCGENNLLLDHKGCFKGVIDYNLSGEDTVLNIIMSYGIVDYGSRRIETDPNVIPYLNKVTQDSVIEKLLTCLKKFSSYYNFTESEIEAAPFLYRYIISIDYSVISAFKECIEDDKNLALVFDFIEYELTSRKIDFRSSMLGKS